MYNPLFFLYIYISLILLCGASAKTYVFETSILIHLLFSLWCSLMCHSQEYFNFLVLWICRPHFSLNSLLPYVITTMNAYTGAIKFLLVLFCISLFEWSQVKKTLLFVLMRISHKKQSSVPQKNENKSLSMLFWRQLWALRIYSLPYNFNYQSAEIRSVIFMFPL